MTKTITMLTTFDNPYDPYDQFREWWQYDMEKGYSTSSYLGRIAKTSDLLSDTENDEEVERAIDEIISIDPFNMYKKIKREVEY